MNLNSITRTFIQKGQGYGSTPVTVKVVIDGSEIFHGEISTVDQPPPVLPDFGASFDADLFTWTNTLDFTGTQSLEITVTGGTVILANSIANFGAADWQYYYPFYRDESRGYTVFDPFSDVMINGAPQTQIHTKETPGQYYWTLSNDSVFQATINVKAGHYPTPWDGTKSYIWLTDVFYDDHLYVANKDVPPGVDIHDREYWNRSPDRADPYPWHLLNTGT